MTYDKYLSLLARILCAKVTESQEIKELYRLVDEELYSMLEQVYFPSMPKLSNRLDKLLMSIEAVVAWPELVGKETIAIYNHFTNKSVVDIEKELKGGDLRWLISNRTQIPLILVDSPKLDIVVVNDSFGMERISKEEYELLLKESRKSKVALNRMVKYFIIKTPFKEAGRCYILDNTYSTATDLYKGLICKKIYKLEESDITYLKKNKLEDMDYILCTDKIYCKIREMGYVSAQNNKYISVVSDELCGRSHTKFLFSDELKYSICGLVSYYKKNLEEKIKREKELKKDIIRNSTLELGGFSDELKKDILELSEAENKVNNVLEKLKNVVDSIDENLNTRISGDGSIMSKWHKDILFEYYFSIAGLDVEEENECIKHILELDYENKALLLSYSKSINSGTKKIVSDLGINAETWEQAKMSIHFIERKEIDEEIAVLINAIGKHRLSTGKEWYYWSLLKKDEEALRRAVQLGSDMAAQKMYLENKEDVKILKILASNLYSEACFDLGKETISDCREHITRLEDKRLVYHKLAAAIGNDGSIQEIIDVLYENVIWNYFCEKGKPFNGNVPTRFADVSKDLLMVCSYLISKKFNTKHNKEICAVINFCLGKNMSEVHSVFYNSASYAAYMCKGYMYEYGMYVKRDLDKALDRYSRVDGKIIPAVKNAKSRVKQKINTRNKQEADEYQTSEDYTGSYSSSVESSSWCFITTAASYALNKGKDCDELNFLRKFRDEYIKGTAEGNALVQEYYNIAPKLIEKINEEKDAPRIYANLWSKYIVPSTEKILQGKWQEAQDIYVAMVVDLSHKYGVAINTEGYEELYYTTLNRIGYDS